jgi:hypothetical protein
METATEPQMKYIRGLVEKKDLNDSRVSDAQREFLSDTTDENLIRMDKAQASAAIKLLLELQDKPRPVTAVDKVEGALVVPEGYYFIVDPTDNVEKFFAVRHGKKDSRWEGFVFLDVQASDFFYPIKDKSHRISVFEEILKDPVSAMNEYGIRIGRCGVCNRTLTAHDSRLRGIGPICADRLYGKPNEGELEALKKLGLLS